MNPDKEADSSGKGDPDLKKICQQYFKVKNANLMCNWFLIVIQNILVFSQDNLKNKSQSESIINVNSSQSHSYHVKSNLIKTF